MCPGGYVVNASSEEKRLAVNGMSYSDRGSKNANSAIIVSVTPDDFEGTDALSGVEFQRRLEEKAFALGNGKFHSSFSVITVKIKKAQDMELFLRRQEVRLHFQI